MLNLKAFAYMYYCSFAHRLNVGVPSNLCMPTQDLEWGCI